MTRFTKYQRTRKGQSLTAPVNYRHVWVERMSQVKILVLTMTLQQVADVFGCTMSALANAMRYHNVSANIERHKNKLK
ncbi:hypothetical protein JLT2_59 [Paraglaciecola Antarctic JLT virus 2]|nr:hypothetical protein JLT2_59 [Paraglaciecola Antarctic JLT virus 2]